MDLDLISPFWPQFFSEISLYFIGFWFQIISTTQQHHKHSVLIKSNNKTRGLGFYANTSLYIWVIEEICSCCKTWSSSCIVGPWQEDSWERQVIWWSMATPWAERLQHHSQLCRCLSGWLRPNLYKKVTMKKRQLLLLSKYDHLLKENWENITCLRKQDSWGLFQKQSISLGNWGKALCSDYLLFLSYYFGKIKILQLFWDLPTGILTEQQNIVTHLLQHFLLGKTGTELWMLIPSGYCRGRRKYVVGSQG